LRKISEIFAEGIKINKICIIAVLSSECELLNRKSVNLINESIARTIEIFSSIFREAKEKDLVTNSVDYKELAHTYFNILNGGQVIGRSLGTTEFLQKSVDAFIQML